MKNIPLDSLPTDANSVQTWDVGHIWFNGGQKVPSTLSNYPSMSDWNSAGGEADITLISIRTPTANLNRISQFCIVNYFNGNWVFRTYARRMVDTTWFSWSPIF